MLFIVGLGNPGFRYMRTRHNLGFRVIDSLPKPRAQRHRLWHDAAFIREWMSGSHRTILAKPMTFMNRSGDVVERLLNAFGGIPSELLVICDDINLPLGKLRMRGKGSDGGHKGLASIIQRLGTEAFPRLRMGVGPVEGDVVAYVLAPFRRSEKAAVKCMIKDARRAVFDFVEEGLDTAMNRINRS